jgi:hypothetical protein
VLRSRHSNQEFACGNLVIIDRGVEKIVFSFVDYHPLEPVDPCFEDGDEGFLSDFPENVSDHAFSALSVRDMVFVEFSLDITKEEEVTWCEGRAVSRVRYPLDHFA